MEYIRKSMSTLQKHAYKLTKARLAVLKVLAIAQKPLSPYEIRDKARLIDMQPITIYRILDVLEELKLAHKSLLDGGYTRCSHLENSGCHHLVLCTECKNFAEFTEDHDHQAEQEKFANLPFKELCHVYELKGLCEECA